MKKIAILFTEEANLTGECDKEKIEKACSQIKTETELNRAGYIIASLGDRYSLDYDLTVHL